MSRLRAAFAALSDHERVMIFGLLLVSGGLALVYPPAALVVPGVVLVAVALGFTLARR